MKNWNFSIDEISLMMGMPDLEIEDLISSSLFQAHCSELPDSHVPQDL
ncbi:MAG: hypothetical protein HW387_1667 [Parachlamydiales bacterium]|nr:hypothetical protein [Parachlamydiales bacterium]